MRYIVALIFTVFIFVGCTTGTGDNTSEDVLTVGNFTINILEYQGESRWNYSVSGVMPTPCHSFTTDAIVAESFPEQVTITVEQKEPGDDEVCIQVVDVQEMVGSFSASEGASVRLVVVE